MLAPGLHRKEGKKETGCVPWTVVWFIRGSVGSRSRLPFIGRVISGKSVTL